MISIKTKINQLFFIISLLFIFSCENDPVSVDNSFSDNNSFFMQSFDILPSQSYTFQDYSLGTGSSYRLYSGNIGEINSKIILRIDTETLSSSKYCMIDSVSASDSTIHSLDSLKIVLRSFDELINEDSLILFDNTALNFSGGFGIIDSWDEDSLELYTNISLPQNMVSFDDSNIEIEDYTIRLELPFNENWCDVNEDYYILISYTPDAAHDFQCLELTSSQYTSGISDAYRPSLSFSYNEFNEIIDYKERFSISSALLNSSIQDIFFVTNDTLSTHSKVFLLNSMPDGLSDTINSQDVFLEDLSLINSTFDSGTYEIELGININNQIQDSISIIDFILDNIIIVADNSDPAEDNTPNGFEGNGLFDSSSDSTELFIDLGYDFCPDLYESGVNNGCLCDFIGAPEACNDILEENIIYNDTGTEGNNQHDPGEEFPQIADVGVDGCPDEREGGLNEQGNPICLDNDNLEYEDGSDPNGDNFSIDPGNDDWRDCGSDGLCDEEEDGFDLESNPDPSNDNWSANNLMGTEGNGVWNEGEGKEGNGIYDVGEPFYDWGRNGVPESEEDNCFDCINDIDSSGLNTENNQMYDFGEPFEDTGIDSVFTIDELGYNPNGTEGNGNFDNGEDFPSEYDCGEDGVCNDGDISDDYNIDPNNDNWLDCGTDLDCEFEDEDGSQGNEIWDEGEGVEGNNQYDSNESFYEFYYDWGYDQLPDSLEALSANQLLSYSAPQTITYTIGQNMQDISNNLDFTKDIVFDIKSISDTKIVLELIANTPFKALQFKLNHSPYIIETTELVHRDEIVRKIDQNDIIDDISDYENSFINYDFNADSTLVLDYLNGIRFSLSFNGLNDFIESNPGIHINESYTTLGLNVIHEDSNYNFFDNQINLWASIANNNKFLTSVSASSNDEILVPFSSVIQDYIDGELGLSDSIIFYIDGVYDNRSRLVIDKNGELSPKLEVFYSR